MLALPAEKRVNGAAELVSQRRELRCVGISPRLLHQFDGGSSDADPPAEFCLAESKSFSPDFDSFRDSTSLTGRFACVTVSADNGEAPKTEPAVVVVL